MKNAINALAHAWHLSPGQYWLLRVVSALSIVPLLGVIYLVWRFLRRRSEP